MRDLISREDAIKAMCYACGHECTEEEMQTCPEHYELTHMPSAEPEPKKGEWIDYSDEGYVECPFCHSATNCDGNKDELHYCFSCGAELRGEKE